MRASLPSRSAVVALALVASVALAGCNDHEGSKGSSAPTTTPGRTSTTPTTPAILPPGATVPPAKASRKVTLSNACTKVVADLRELMTKYANGFQVSPEDGPKLNTAMGTAQAAISGPSSTCDADEFRRFYDEEFLGWLTPPDSGVRPATTTTTPAAAT